MSVLSEEVVEINCEGLFINMGLISALNRALSKYSPTKEKQIMEIATIRS